ncbi:DUF5719 family protein [Actinotalea subterranea]|uniref:DUF5719 family protein n=1 Tax=Actinotalea subterranea TaxID=2607497 RepID=UPI0011EFB318|nr:DUF5719 family protein [Actinotalea subterranea]
MTTEPTGDAPTTTPTSPTTPTGTKPTADVPGRGARLRRGLARGLTALLVLGVTAGVVVAGTRYAPPAAPEAVDLPRVAVDAAATRLVCPGALRLATEPEPGDDVAYDPQFDPSPGESTVTVRAATVEPAAGQDRDDAGAGRLTDLAGEATTAELEPVGAGDVVGVQAPASTPVIEVRPAGHVAAWAAGAVGVTTALGDLRGLAAASCQRASAQTWLVGGSTSLGSSARLVLQNPGRTAATVRVDLWGPSGAVELAGAPEFLVPAGAERVVLLEGVAAEQSRIVTRLTSSGGVVSAYLQDSQLRGLVPAGVDYVVAGQEPATRQVVPALSVTATQLEGADTSVLRLLAPADDATATITLHGRDGEVLLPGAQQVELDAGVVLDLPLDGLPVGDYTAVVESDVPVVAGALLTRGAGVGLPAAGTGSQLPLDRAWVPSSDTSASGGGVLALPAGTDGRLVVGVTGESGAPADVALEVLDQTGAVVGEADLTLQAGTTTSLALSALATAGGAGVVPQPAAVVVRTDDDRVAWAAVLLTPDPAGDLVSVLAPVTAPALQPDVGVRTR